MGQGGTILHFDPSYYPTYGLTEELLALSTLANTLVTTLNKEILSYPHTPPSSTNWADWIFLDSLISCQPPLSYTFISYAARQKEI